MKTKKKSSLKPAGFFSQKTQM